MLRRVIKEGELISIEFFLFFYDARGGNRPIPGLCAIVTVTGHGQLSLPWAHYHYHYYVTDENQRDERAGREWANPDSPAHNPVIKIPRVAPPRSSERRRIFRHFTTEG